MTDLQSWNDLAELDEYVPENNLLLIDGNNLAYRFLNRQNHDNYGEEYIRTVKSLGKSYKAKRIIVCFDFGKSYYRIELHDKYKGTRKKPTEPEEIEKFERFFGCLNDLIDNDFPLEYYKMRGVEADDLITFFTMKEQKKYEHIWIVSSDKDLYQLLDEDISIFNLYSRREITIDTLLEDRGITPDEFLLAKIIAGDSSDNIIGIEGIGDKRSADLARTHINLTKLMLALPIKKSSKYIKNLNAGKKQLALNEKLINLKKYNKEAVKAGKNGNEDWKILNDNI